MKAAVVLGGGSVRGFFHIGVLKALHELDVEITEIAGCSVGAFMGAVYASNPEKNLEELAESIDFIHLLEITYRSESVFGTKRIETYFRTLFPETFEELKIPLHINATDINTGREIILSSGDLVSAILASMAVPSLFPLVERNGLFLSDGGSTNNVPLSNVRAHRVIISNTNPPLNSITKKASKRQILHNIALLPLHSRLQHELQTTKKNVHHFQLGTRVNLVDLRKTHIKQLIQKGYDAVMERKKELQ